MPNPSGATQAPSRQTQLRYADAGKCQQCGKRKPATETLCHDCAAKHREATSSHKAKLIKMGLCSQCGREPLATARCCRDCQDKHNARVYAARAAALRRPGK